MNRLLLIICILITLDLVYADNNKKIYKVGLPEVPGLMFRNQAGEPRGIPLEITAQILNEGGIEFVWVDGSWTELYNKLKNGDIDLLPGTIKTEDREDIFDFTDNYFYLIWSEIFIHNDTEYLTIRNFNEKKIGFVRNDFNAQGFDTYIKKFHINYEPVYFNSHKDAIRAVERKEIYGVAAPNPNLLDNLLGKHIKRSGLYFNPSILSIAFPKGKNSGLRKLADSILTEFKADPESQINCLLDKYRVSHITPQKPFIPTWLFYTLIIAFSCAIIAFTFVFFLRRQVKIQTDELLNAKNKAEESEMLKSAFLANMSHEIRTPLNAIVGFSELIAETDTSISEKKEFSDIISKQSALLLTLINDIIDISKIESNSLEINITKDVLLINILEEVYHSFLNNIPDNVEFDFQMQNSDIKINTDVFRLKQIIINFTTNAFKYTTQGKVILGSKIINDSDIIRIFVKDTGLGIEPELINQVFDRFQKNNSLIQGAGLGLSIAKSLSDILGYEIGVNSELGIGSEFYIDIKK